MYNDPLENIAPIFNLYFSILKIIIVIRITIESYLILHLREISKKCDYDLKNRGILSTIVALREENGSQFFYPLFTNNVT